MRTLLVLTVLLVAPAMASATEACAGPACAYELRGEGCGSDGAQATQGGVRLVAEGRRDCPDGTSNGTTDVILVELDEPDGHEQVVWEHHAEENASYTWIGVVRPPRFVSWYEDAHGCSVDLDVAGARSFACAAGSPPSPPEAPWGHLLP